MKKKELIIYSMLLTVLFVAIGVYILSNEMNTDTKPPVIAIDSEVLSISVKDPESALLQGVSAQDDRDGDVTELVLVEKISDLAEDHTAVVTYAAFDRSGNVSKATRSAHYTDYTSPTFSLQTPLVFQANTNPDVLRLVTVTDAIDGDISRNLKATLTGTATSLSVVGTHPVAFRITNSMGDTVRVTIPVDILPTNTYHGTIRLTRNLVYIAQDSVFKPKDYFHSWTIGTETFTGSDNLNLQITSDVDTSVPGVYSVAYTARHDGRQAFTRLIVIVE